MSRHTRRLSSDIWVRHASPHRNSSSLMPKTASKIRAEKAAWDFVAQRHTNFSVTTILPGYILGPIIHSVSSIDAINASGELVRDFITGKYKDEIPVSMASRWVDVRDTALVHVRAVEVEQAGGKRFLIGGGTFSNREVATILWKNCPALRHKLPGPEIETGGYPAAGLAKYDVEPSRKILGVEYHSLEESLVGMTGSLIGLYEK